jgi:hypothetical protein
MLLVYRVDRFARSVRGLAPLLEELDAAGVAFRSATEPFDTTTAAGWMMVQMLGVFAEFERATIVDRVIAAWNAKLLGAAGVEDHDPSATWPTRQPASWSQKTAKPCSCLSSSTAMPTVVRVPGLWLCG